MAKTKPPYFKFYPKDFLADTDVEFMTTAGVGAYILLLCRSWHESPPGSIPADDRLLARMARMTDDAWLDVKQEVLAAFKVGDDGRYHQRRMRKEYEDFAVVKKKAQDAANTRWEREREKKSMRPHSDGIASAMPTNGSGSGSNSPPGGGSAEGGGAFDAFWAGVPNKRGKGDARRAFDKAVKAGTPPEDIIAGLPKFVAYEQKRAQRADYTPLHPATWINGERWTDDVTASARKLDPLDGKSKPELDGLYALACEQWPDCKAQGRGSDYTRARMAKLARGAA